jgi:hypothetical protein
MALPKRQVFISSTAKDLAEFRSAAIAKIERLDGWKCANMERFGARAGRTVEVCKKMVQNCDLFLGIFGHLYGSCPEGSPTSYTEHEYEAAITANIPRLMFLAEDGVAVSPELLAKDSNPSRQVAFRERVKYSGEIIGRFTTAADLATDATTAIANWQSSQAPLSAEAPRRGRGDIVSKLCDRAKQEAQFWESFRGGLAQTTGLPQIYFVRGEEQEAPGSLIERFRLKTIQEHANRLWPADGVVTYKNADWPLEGDEKFRCARLIDLLFTEWEAGAAPDLSEANPGAIFARRIAPRRDKFMIMKHDLRAGKWDAAAFNSLKRYLEFWDDAAKELASSGGATTRPQWVIFINVIYPYEKPASRLLRWVPGLRGFDPARLEAALLSVLNPRQTRVSDTRERLCPAHLLEPLHCVERDDVMAWFSSNQIFDDEPVRRRQFCDEVFQTEKCRHMDELESALTEILRKAAAAI